MTQFDYVIVGAGPAGCVLANRLSADPGSSVLLVEAGDEDTNPLIAMPRGFGELLGDPTTVWHYPTRPFGPTQRVEYWVRGKTLGGSSSVNGMVYNRGHRADYDALERLGNPGWGWDDMLPVFKTIENNQLGASDVRGAGGPLHVSTVERDRPAARGRDHRRRPSSAGGGCGTSTRPTSERIGYTMATIRDGQRVSAADAFLHPVMDRPNLTVALRTVVDQVVLDGGRAVGVRGRQNGQAFEAQATREVILATGSIATPKILQLSGIGPADALRSAGVDVAVDSPNVGARHARAPRVHAAVPARGRPRVQQAAQHRGRPAGGGGGVPDDPARAAGGALVRHRRVLQDPPGARPPRRPDPDRAVLDAAARTRQGASRWSSEPGMLCVGYILRPDSEGSIHITSADPDAPLDIDANYFATEHDRTTAVGVFRGMRRLFATGPLAKRIERETVPGPTVQADQEIIDAGLTMGGCGYHAIGTCAMGPNDDDVVDPRLRVRGVTNLRVVDASVLPIMVSGNLNGPVSALAWRAADFILEDA